MVILYVSAQDVLNESRGIHGTAANLNPSFFMAGGKYVSQPTANQGGDHVILWVGPEGYVTPYTLGILAETFTTASTAGTSTPITGLGALKDLEVVADVTLANGTAPTLDLYIDGRLDGTNYENIGHLTQITATGRIGVHLTKRQNAAQTQAINVDAGSGTIRPLGFGDAIRVRRTIGGTLPSFSATVYISGVA